MWWKENRWKLLFVVAVVAALTVAFCWGEAPSGRPNEAGESVRPAAAVVSTVPSTEPVSSARALSETPEPPSSSSFPSPTPEVTEPSPSPATEEPALEEKLSCTLSIQCTAVLARMDDLTEEQQELIPQDGTILGSTTVRFEEGESVFDLLQRVCREEEIHMEFSNTPLSNHVYIEGIQNLYELDLGALSGWMYQVNGWFPNYSCSQYAVKDGDMICWMYTCDLGKDIGGEAAGGQRGE